jgi:hypothetical protein
MIDSSVLFLMDDERPDLLEKLAAVAGRVELLTTHVQEDEDLRGSTAAARLPLRKVKTHGAVLGLSRLGEARFGDVELIRALRDGNLAHSPDAIITATASAEGAVLVIRDRKAVARLKRSGLDLEVWGPDELESYVDALLADQ